MILCKYISQKNAMKIIINHNLCDEAPECGGIEVCPTGAFAFNEEAQRVQVDQKKCITCLKCTLPSACPVGCIYFARDENDKMRIEEMLKLDPKTESWLWEERYGCYPGKTAPFASTLTSKNFKESFSADEYKLVDYWNYNSIDCRYHSQLFTDILKDVKAPVSIYKVDCVSEKDISKQMKIINYPSLVLYDKSGKEIYRYEGLMKEANLTEVNKEIKALIK